MDRKLLQDYVDACELIKETEQEIDKLKSKRVLQDSVKGSMRNFPYTPVSVHISGVEYSAEDEKALREQEQWLQKRRAAAQQIKVQVDQWMSGIPARMQRIVKYRYFERMPWEQIVIKMGGNATENSIKKEFERYMKNN